MSAGPIPHVPGAEATIGATITKGAQHVHELNYAGPVGGLIGQAVIGTAVAITGFWLAIGATLWKAFFEPRIKTLEEERDEERARCDAQIILLTNRIAQLEGALMLHGPQQLREAVQLAISERALAEQGIRPPLSVGVRLPATEPKGGSDAD